MSALSYGLLELRQNDSDIDAILASRDEEITALLTQYVAEIEFFNPAYGLVGDVKEIVARHILDSLAPMGIIYREIERGSGKPERVKPQDRENQCGQANQPQELELQSHNGESRIAARTVQIADAGSGAGLPGIPLAIVMPGYDFTLIERTGRRAGFLWNTKAKLGLSNVTVEEGELERTTPGFFDCIAFRAFKPLEPKLLKSLFRSCAPGGFLAAYKAKKEKIALEMSPLETYAGWEAIPCGVPFLNEERHLVIIRPKNSIK